MKKILFLFVMLLGVQSVWAQSSEKSDGNVVFEEAVKALEQKKFIVRFNTMDYRSQRRKQLDNETNFFILDVDSTFYQYDDGRSEYRRHGSVFYMASDIEKGKVKNIEIGKDKKNNFLLSLSTQGKSRHSSYTIMIVLENGTNNCIATLKNYWGNHYYTGTLYPIDATTVMKAN